MSFCARDEGKLRPSRCVHQCEECAAHDRAEADLCPDCDSNPCKPACPSKVASQPDRIGADANRAIDHLIASFADAD